jgi:hypothetical protein
MSKRRRIHVYLNHDNTSFMNAHGCPSRHSNVALDAHRENLYEAFARIDNKFDEGEKQAIIAVLLRCVDRIIETTDLDGFQQIVLAVSRQRLMSKEWRSAESILLNRTSAIEAEAIMSTVLRQHYDRTGRPWIINSKAGKR